MDHYISRRNIQTRAGKLLQAGLLVLLVLFSLSYGLGHGLRVSAATRTDTLWGVSQACDAEISSPQNSLNGPRAGFDGKTAACTLAGGARDPAWTIDRFERVRLEQIDSVSLEIGFFVSGWNMGQVLVLQASNDGGRQWADLESFDRSNPPPAALDQLELDASQVFRTRKNLRNAQVRLVYQNQGQPATDLPIFLDGMRLVVSGENAPPPPAPTENPTATPPEPSPTPTATPVDTPVETPAGPIEFTPTRAPGKPPAPPSATPTATPLSPFARNTAAATLAGTTTATLLSEQRPTAVLTATVTLSATAILTPTATPTPQPAPVDTGRGQLLWAVDQACDFPIDQPENSLDGSFNDQLASCSGDFAGKQASWQLLAFQYTTFTHIDAARLELRLSISGWVDDQLALELFDGTQWTPIDQLDASHTLPPAGTTNLAYDLTGLLPSAVEVNQLQVRLRGVQANQAADPMTISLDAARLVVSGGAAGMQAVGPIATPSSLSLVINSASVPGDPHADFSPTTDSCAGCHRAHTGQGSWLRDSWPEEALCYACHSSAGPGTSVQPAFANNPNSATRYFSHPVSGTNGVHQLAESSGSRFGGANRHIECEDCHDPHQAARGSSAAPALQAEMSGTSGVDPIWNGPGGPSGFSWLATASREYQVCFKCHSSYSSLPGYAPDGWNGSAYIANGLRKLTSGNSSQVLDSRDMAREFNPNQASFHPVAAPGRNTNISANSFVNGWTQSSLVYCSDCHTNANPGTGGTGPHGSPLLHLLGGFSNYSTVMQNNTPRVPSTEICFSCHSYQTYVTGQNQSSHFPFHEKHMDNSWGTTCYTCHDSHGSEQLHLINFDTSVVTPLNGRNSQTAWYYDPATGRAGCYISCHGDTHNPEEYRP